MSATHILYESSVGYHLLIIKNNGLNQIQDPNFKLDWNVVRKLAKPIGFRPFSDANDALLNLSDISEGVCNEALADFIKINLHNESKENIVLGVMDKNLGGNIRQITEIVCSADEDVFEMIRVIRSNETQFFNEALSSANFVMENKMEKARLGLAHNYSRMKVKFNVNKNDNMVLHSITLLDQIDKDVNAFSMRIREWFGWHFPEMGLLIKDHMQYAKLALLMKNKDFIQDYNITDLEDKANPNYKGVKKMVKICENDTEMVQRLIEASKTSMGTEISELDIINISNFSRRLISLLEYRSKLSIYLNSKLSYIAPNLQALLGTHVSARLISHAGSLTNLAKSPASTIQILGAEKALFRALKAKSNTPKYGLLFHSSHVSKAVGVDKGRIARLVANKAAIACRVDAFSDNSNGNTILGDAMRDQIDQRLLFLAAQKRNDESVIPLKNADVMNEALSKIHDMMDVDEKPKKKSKKEKSISPLMDEPLMDASSIQPKKSKKIKSAPVVW